MIIRNARAADLDRIYEITCLSFGPYSRAKLREDRYGVVDGVGWEQRKGTSVRDACERNLDLVLVAEEDGRIVGYYTYGLDREIGIAEIKGNAVDPAYQGRGIGTRLSQATLGRIRTSKAVDILFVWTIVRDKPARRVYEKMGFKELTRTIDTTALASELKPGPMDSDRSLVIRSASAKDLPRIRQIAAEGSNPFCQDCFALEPMQQRHGIIGGRTSQQRRIERAQAFCEAETNRVYVAERNETVLGYGGYTPSGGTEVGLIYPSADPACEAHAVRRRLMQELIGRITTEKASAILSVSVMHEDLDGQSTCEAMGFTELTRGISYTMWNHED